MISTLSGTPCGQFAETTHVSAMGGSRRAAPSRFAHLVARSDLEALAIVGHSNFSLARRESTEPAKRTAEGVSADVIERPHVLGIETQMRLSSQRLAVRTDEAEILDGIGNVPAVIAIFPLAAT